MAEMVDEEFKGIKKKLDFIWQEESAVCISFSTPKQEMAKDILGSPAPEPQKFGFKQRKLAVDHSDPENSQTNILR